MLEAKKENFVGEVVTLKTTSGHEVMGRVVSRDDTITVLSNPQAIMQHYDEKGQPQMGILDFMLTGESAYVEFPTATVAISKTKKAFVEEYNRITSSLVVPQKPGIIT